MRHGLRFAPHVTMSRGVMETPVDERIDKHDEPIANPTTRGR